MNGELKFTQSFDAVDWAKAFVEIAKKKGPDFATDEATMTGWFANAIMRGYDEHAERNKDALSLAAAVEGPEEACPETDAAVVGLPIGTAPEAHARRMERRLLAALRALKAERERSKVTTAGEDAAGRFGRLEVVDQDNEGRPLQYGNVAIAMRNGMWLGTNNGFPAGQPALYSPERAARIVESWNAALAAQEGRHD